MAEPGEWDPEAASSSNHPTLSSLIREAKDTLSVSRSRVQRMTDILNWALLPQENQGFSGNFSAHFAQLGAIQKTPVGIAFPGSLSFLSVPIPSGDSESFRQTTP